LLFKGKYLLNTIVLPRTLERSENGRTRKATAYFLKIPRVTLGISRFNQPSLEKPRKIWENGSIERGLTIYDSRYT